MPSSGPVGSIIEIAGYIIYNFQNSFEHYERLFLGGSTCDPRTPGTNDPYGRRTRWPLRFVKCITTEQQVGGWKLQETEAPVGRSAVPDARLEAGHV